MKREKAKRKEEKNRKGKDRDENLQQNESMIEKKERRERKYE